MPIPLALLAWLVVGAAAGLLAVRAVPGHPPLRPLGAAFIGMAGALVGGLLATFFGFGGLAGFDPRGLVAAGLGTVVALLLFRGVTLASR